MPSAPTAEALWPDRFAGRRGTVAIILRASARVGETLRALPRNSEVRLDPLAALLIEDPRVTRLIGQLEPAAGGAHVPSAVRARKKKREEGEDAPDPIWASRETPSWVAIERGGGVFAAVVRIGFRGARITAQSEPDAGPAMKRMAARGKAAAYTLGVAKGKGWTRGTWSARHGVESERLYSFEAFAEAVEQAKVALRRAGCVLAARTEIANGGQSATAAIWLRALPPSLSPSLKLQR